jgi:hypothetical protein
LAASIDVADRRPAGREVADAVRIAGVVHNRDGEVARPRGQQVCNVITTAVADHDDLNIT